MLLRGLAHQVVQIPCFPPSLLPVEAVAVAKPATSKLEPRAVLVAAVIMLGAVQAVQVTPHLFLQAKEIMVAVVLLELLTSTKAVEVEAARLLMALTPLQIKAAMAATELPLQLAVLA